MTDRQISSNVTIMFNNLKVLIYIINRILFNEYKKKIPLPQPGTHTFMYKHLTVCLLLKCNRCYKLILMSHV